MKKQWISLSLALALCLSMTACTAGPDEETTAPFTTAGTTAPEETAAPELSHPLNAAGKQRITYNGNVSSVRYVTSPDQLPNLEGLEAYDEAYFQDHALIFVTETVSSGSALVDIESITITGSTAVVTLSHEMQGDVGTTDMATWVLWAEVEPGLNCTWTVANPALKSNTITE